MPEVTERIRQFLAKHVSKDRISDDENIFATRHVNSLFAMQLVMFLEKEFAIRLEGVDLQFENFQSLKAIVCLVEGKMLPITPVTIAK